MDGEKKVVMALGPEELLNGRPAKGPGAEHFAVIRGLKVFKIIERDMFKAG